VSAFKKNAAQAAAAPSWLVMAVMPSMDFDGVEQLPFFAHSRYVAQSDARFAVGE
jgi:hypothetical protein